MSGRKKNAKLLLLGYVSFAFIGFMGWGVENKFKQS